jgi:hypothetical protein
MERAAQLAEVAAAVYDKGGVAIRLPLDGDHPLVAVMSAAVRKEQVHTDMLPCRLPLQQATLSCAGTQLAIRLQGGKRSSVGAKLGQQLLEAVLAAHESSTDTPTLQAFPPLLVIVWKRLEITVLVIVQHLQQLTDL